MRDVGSKNGTFFNGARITEVQGIFKDVFNLERTFNTDGSQFFLVYEDSTIPSDTAGGYTVFGRITSGLDVLQAIADGGIGSPGGWRSGKSLR